MKATFTSKQGTGEKCLNKAWQPLPIILFTLFFSIISTSHGGYLLAGTSRCDASGDKSEGEYDHAPSVSFQEVQDIVAQPTIEWDKTFGGSSDDELHTAIPTSEGGYLLAGSSRSNTSGDKSENSKGDYDYWIVKTDAQGDKVWDKTLGGSSRDELFSAIPAPDGGYLLAGRSSSNASEDKSENSKGHNDYWVIKIDTQGNKVWDKTLGGSNADGLHSAISTPDGGYLLGGTSVSNALGDKSENSKGQSDYWVIKIDANGNKQWDKTFGGSSYDELYSTALTPDGGYLLGGTSRSKASGDKSEPNRGLADHWIVKIDAEGNKAWDKTFGGSSDDYLEGTISTPDGGYLLVGWSGSPASGDKSENSKGAVDAWIVKIDALGNKIWDKTLGGRGYEGFNSAISTADGGYLLTGPSDSPVSGDKSEKSKGLSDYWVVKIDALGNKIWDKTIGGSGTEGVQSTISIPDGGYLLAGYSNSPASGDKSENSKGSWDYWIVKFKEPQSPVKSLTLINAETDQEIGELRNGDVIDLADVGSALLSIRANTLPEMIGRVEFALNGPITHTQVEKNAPYALFGNSEDDYAGRQLPAGKYILTVTPYIKNKKSIALTISFEVVKDIVVIHLTLIDAATDEEIRELRNEDVIDLAEVGNVLLNIRANTFPEKLGRVEFALNGPITHTQVEKNAPYALFGNSKDDYAGRQMPAGKYTLTATPFFKNTKGIALTVSFEVVKEGVAIQPTIEWDKTLGGNRDDYLFSAISTPDGGYLVGGYSESNISGEKSENEKGNFEGDYWVVKTDAQGNKQWDKTFGGNHSDWLRSISLTPDGGYLLTGYSDSDASGDKSENSKGGSDYWVIKIDAQGNKVWDKTLGGNDDEQFQSAIPTPDGGYLLGGYSLSNASGDKSEHSKGELDYWVVKIDEKGNKVWDKTLGGNSGDLLFNAISTPNGGYLLGGTSSSDASGDKSEDSKGERDYWVVKIDAQGNKVWDKTIGGSDEEDLQSVISTPEGGYLLGGYSGSNASGDKSEGNKGVYDYWVVKIDADGNKVWDKTIGGNNGDLLFSVISTPDGGYLLVGSSGSNASGDKSENSKGFSDYWVVKIDVDGNKVWDKTIGGSDEEQLQSVITTPDGGYLLAGFSRSNASGDKSENSRGGLGFADYWIVKIKDHTTPTVTSLTLIDAETDQEISDFTPEATVRQVKVYPVPTSDVLNILHEGTGEEAVLMLLDFRGKMLLHQPMSQQPLEQVDLSGFKKGTYYLRIVSAEGVQVFRVAKE